MVHRFLKAMLRFGHKQNNADHTMFLKHDTEKVNVLIVCAHDIVVTSNDLKEMTQLKAKLAKEFKIKDLGSLRYFFGIEGCQIRKRHLYLSKEVYY